MGARTWLPGGRPRSFDTVYRNGIYAPTLRLGGEGVDFRVAQ